MKAMKKMRYLMLLPALFAAGTLAVSCTGERDMPEPPSTDLQANITIEDLIDRYRGVAYAAIDTALYIEGVVTANDVAGTIYKKIFVQDSTAGIDIEIEMTNNNHKYPVGQRLVIALDGLAFGRYGGQPQIGGQGGVETVRLYEPECDEHFFRKGYASSALVPDPVVLSLKDANSRKMTYCGMLIRLDSVYFVDSGQVFVDVSADLPGNAQNRNLADYRGKSQNTLAVRISQYATFALDTLPGGCGSVVGILGVYNEDPQLFLRDRNDLIGFRKAMLPKETADSVQMAGF